MSTDAAPMESEPRRPWYKARVPTPVAWIIYVVLFLFVAAILYGVIHQRWALAALRAAGAEVHYAPKGCHNSNR